MASLNELKYQALLTNTGEVSGTINGLEYLWLIQQTGETGGTLNQLRMIYLTQNGILSGPHNERWFGFLAGHGYAGTLGEKFYQFWADGGTVPDILDDLVVDGGEAVTDGGIFVIDTE